jgi:SAM-dependent methyltransferase
MYEIRSLGAYIIDGLREEFLIEAFDKAGSREVLLDVGCGTRPFRDMYDRYVEYSVGTDVPYSPHDIGEVQVLANGMALPFADEVFDIILCTEVMEHVPEPAMLMAEFSRMLKPGGLLVMTTPFMVPVHEAPYDFYRYTNHGLIHLCGKAGLTVREIRPFAGLGGVLLSFLVQFQIRIWTPLSKFTRLAFLRRMGNPLVFLFVFLPQWLYIELHRILGDTRLSRKILEKTSYTTKGYGLLAEKPHNEMPVAG